MLSLPWLFLRFAAFDSQFVFRAASATEVNRGEVQRVREAPKPIVKIDNQHDPFATVVSIQYGNKLGELLDTVGPATFFVLYCSVAPVCMTAVRVLTSPSLCVCAEMR